MQKRGKASEDLLKKELEAQKKRAEALAYLQENGCGPSQFEKNLTPQGFIGTAEAIKSGVSRDNTIEQVRKRKKDLLSQQQSIREKIVAAHEARPISNALPPGWKEVKDPSSGRIYYWNKTTGKTQWLRPESMPEIPDTNKETVQNNNLQSAPQSDNSQTQKSQETSESNLPPGWEQKFHPGSKQYYYIHKDTKERRWTKPETETDKSDIKPIQQEETFSSQHSEDHHHLGKKKKKKKKKGHAGVDPLDPTGNKKGRWSDGLINMGERMADSTASGPLWQQRPYPAPGQVLRGLSKPKEPKVGVSMMKPAPPPVPR